MAELARRSDRDLGVHQPLGAGDDQQCSSAAVAWNAWIFGVATVILALWALPTHREVGQTVRPSNRLDLR